MEELAQSIENLKNENAKLKAQIVGSDALEKEELDKYQLIKKLESMVREQSEGKSVSKERISEYLEHFEYRHADYGQERKSMCEYHLKQVERLLSPTETTKMAIWSLHQDDDFYTEKADDLTGSPTLWDTLSSLSLSLERIELSLSLFLSLSLSLY